MAAEPTGPHLAVEFWYQPRIGGGPPQQKLSLRHAYADASALSLATARRTAARWVESGRLPDEPAYDGSEVPGRYAVILRIEQVEVIGPAEAPATMSAAADRVVADADLRAHMAREHGWTQPRLRRRSYEELVAQDRQLHDAP